MMHRTILASAALAGLFIGGCEKKETTTTPAGTSTTTTNNPLPGSDALKNAANSAKDAAANGANTVKDATGNAMDAVKAQADTAMGGDTAAKLQQVTDYIKQNKLDMAEKALKEVESNKGSLPAALQQQVTGLRTQLDALKATNGAAGGGVSMPGMPGMGK